MRGQRLLQRSITRAPLPAKRPMAMIVIPDARSAIRNRFRFW